MRKGFSDASFKYIHFNWFADVTFYSKCFTESFSQRFIHSCEKESGSFSEQLYFSDALIKVESVHWLHLEVENEEVGSCFFEHFKRLLSAACSDNREAPFF